MQVWILERVCGQNCTGTAYKVKRGTIPMTENYVDITSEITFIFNLNSHDILILFCEKAQQRTKATPIILTSFHYIKKSEILPPSTYTLPL